MSPTVRLVSLLILLVPFLVNCTAVTVVGATAGAAVAVTGTAVKTTGAVAGAVIPGDDDDEKD